MSRRADRESSDGAVAVRGAEVKKILKRNLRRLMNLWPPFLGAGIRVTRLDGDWRAVDAEMKLRRWNRNYVGTHYGGSLYSMADPFYMLMLIENLGREYVVWDKSASIRFRKPGRGTVRAEFRLTEEQIEEIERALEKEEKIEREFGVEVKDAEGVVIVEVRKLLHLRKKDGGSGGAWRENPRCRSLRSSPRNSEQAGRAEDRRYGSKEDLVNPRAQALRDSGQAGVPVPQEARKAKTTEEETTEIKMPVPSKLPSQLGASRAS